MKRFEFLFSYLKSAVLVFFMSLCLGYPGYAAGRDVTLQWDKSIDDPYIQSYKVYYYTTSGNLESLSDADYAATYTLPGVINPIAISRGGPKPITIDKINTEITLYALSDRKDYYFAVTAVDTRGLEGIPTPEISILKLTVTKAGTGTGTITSSPSGIRSDINCGTVCTSDSADYAGDTLVTLTAAPDANNAFTGWSGGGCSGTGTCTVTMSPAVTVTATFMPLRRLDVVKAGTGVGTVTGLPLGISSDINCGTACSADSADYIIGTTVTLTYAPDAGNTFTGWGGVCSGTGPCVVTVDAAKSVTATFMPLRRLDFVKAGTGTGTVTGLPLGISSDINCGTACSSDSADYIIGTTVTLTAAPNSGNTFTGWGGGCSGTGLCVVTMDAVKSVTATFMPLRRLDVVKAGTGTGTVTGLPLGISSDINCGTACSSDSADYIIGTTVTLTAAPDAGNTFTGWGGGCSGTGLCVVTMDAAKSVTATFMPLLRLDVVKAGTGTGTVTGLPLGISSDINCGMACSSDSADYIISTLVTLTATPDAGNVFTGWSGDGCSGTGLCVVTMDTAKSVTATFMPLRRLDVVKAGTGTGTVTGLPLGIGSDINCGTPCSADSADYIIGTLVTLTATPDAENAFTGWSGDGCSGTGPCVVTMDAAKSITATFMPLRRLDVVKTGAGAGTVATSPSGMNCGTVCSADYIIDTSVAVTATPDAGSIFTGWSGEWCSGIEPCVVTMDKAKSVTATFMVKGDINLDGTVNITDAVLIFQIMSGAMPASVNRVADTNNDGKLGMEDAIHILQKASGMR